MRTVLCPGAFSKAEDLRNMRKGHDTILTIAVNPAFETDSTKPSFFASAPRSALLAGPQATIGEWHVCCIQPSNYLLRSPMIDRITSFPFPIINTGGDSGESASSPIKGITFQDVLAQSLGNPRVGQTASFLYSNPVALSPYPAGIQNEPGLKESPRDEVIDFILKAEGSSYVSRDGGKESSKYGVLESTAHGYGFQGSIKDLTRADAAAIYQKMWKESGAQKLPRDLAIVHFDTYINSPVAARKMLAASGGDTEKYLELRTERYTRLAEKRPERYAKYMKGWMNRIEHLRTMVAQCDTSSANGST